mmetsp:Transcript_10111/g.29434  ORF Transcript_10111/g.29434 Transcript_10111/m.29434 type:complete len:219 (+) Transcript_10111:536-1192(+)
MWDRDASCDLLAQEAVQPPDVVPSTGRVRRVAELGCAVKRHSRLAAAAAAAATIAGLAAPAAGATAGCRYDRRCVARGCRSGRCTSGRGRGDTGCAGVQARRAEVKGVAAKFSTGRRPLVVQVAGVVCALAPVAKARPPVPDLRAQHADVGLDAGVRLASLAAEVLADRRNDHPEGSRCEGIEVSAGGLEILLHLHEHARRRLGLHDHRRGPRHLGGS